VAFNCSVNLSELRATEQDCQLYALLLRAAKRYYNADNKLNVKILKKSSVLQIGRARPYILRLCSKPD